MFKKHAFLRFFAKIAIFACVFCTIPAWSETTCDIDYTPVTGNSIQTGNPTPTAPVEIESVGTKVGNKYQLQVTAQSKNLFDKTRYDGHGWYPSSGKIADANTTNATIPMRLTPGKVYYYKHCSVTGGFRVFYTTEENWTTDSSATWLVQNPTTDTANKVGSFTVPNDAKWVFIMAGRKESGSTTTILQEQLDDYMLSEEPITADTPYTPYSAPITTNVYLDEPLRKVGDYADVLDYKNGTITRNVGVKVLDGTETWNRFDQTMDVIYGSVLSGANTNTRHALSNALYFNSSHRSTGALTTNEFFKGDNGSPNRIYINLGTYTDTTIADWKTYLAEQYAAGTPVTVYYPLATPVVEQIENWSCTPPITDIKIATTKYVDDEFAPLNTALENAISVVDNVVTQTIAQAGQIATLQNTKQTRPSDDNECPAGKKCLLVTDESGTPHWYPIVECILPDAYTQLEYIESTGTQYIDTGIEYSTNAVLDLKGTATTSDTITFFLSPINSDTYQEGFGQYKNGISGMNTIDISVRTTYNVTYTNQGITVNGTTSNVYNIPNNSHISLFGSTYARRRTAGLKMYSVKIYNASSLVFDGLPAKRNSDGKVGLYDMVSGTFFENAGTGSFVAGPTVF